MVLVSMGRSALGRAGKAGKGDGKAFGEGLGNNKTPLFFLMFFLDCFFFFFFGC